MFNILADTLRTAVKGSKPKHQRMSHEEWQNRFVPPSRRSLHDQPYRFDRNRDLW